MSLWNEGVSEDDENVRVKGQKEIRADPDSNKRQIFRKRSECDWA